MIIEENKELSYLNKNEIPHQKKASSVFGDLKKYDDKAFLKTFIVKCYLPVYIEYSFLTDKKYDYIYCHYKIARNLQRIYGEAINYYGEDFYKLNLHMNGGCYNRRKIRHGKSYSMHSWGIAFDIDPENNGFSLKKEDKPPLSQKKYRPFWDIVYKHGGVSLGLEKGYDYMHFQFARFE